MKTWFADTWWGRTSQSLTAIKQDTAHILEALDQKAIGAWLDDMIKLIEEAAARVPSVKK